MAPLVSIGGFRDAGVEYTEPGQFITAIVIYGLDESLGYGSEIAIRMNQGKTYNKEEGRKNADANIRIIISMTNGGTITLKFSDDVTPFTGYW